MQRDRHRLNSTLVRCSLQFSRCTNLSFVLFKFHTGSMLTSYRENFYQKSFCLNSTLVRCSHDACVEIMFDVASLNSTLVRCSHCKINQSTKNNRRLNSTLVRCSRQFDNLYFRFYKGLNSTLVRCSLL